MFNSPTENLEQESFAPAAEMAEEELAEELPESDIHSMPNRFLKPMNSPQKKSKVSWLVLGIFAFVVLGGAILLAFLFLKKQSLPATVVETPQVNEIINTNNNPDEGNTNTNNRETTPKQRDDQRIGHVADIRNALSLYFGDNNVFPNSLSSLATQYITAVPNNPQPGGVEYEYKTDSDQQNYQLNFQLESGGLMGVVRLGAGTYVATADKIMTKNEFESLVNANQNINMGVPNVPQLPSPTPLPVLGLDSDGDQLTDIEENVYQTNSALADTDGDGYTDTSEILNFYDPKIPGGRLMDSGLIEVYPNTVYNYSLLYPKQWTSRSLTADKKEIIFTSSTGEFIEVIIQENPLALSAYNWFVNQNPGMDTQGIKSLIVAGLPAIQTADGLNTYLSAGTKIFHINYNIGTNNQVNFSTTYQLFLKSFMFTEPQGNPG